MLARPAAASGHPGACFPPSIGVKLLPPQPAAFRGLRLGAQAGGETLSRAHPRHVTLVVGGPAVPDKMLSTPEEPFWSTLNVMMAGGVASEYHLQPGQQTGMQNERKRRKECGRGCGFQRGTAILADGDAGAQRRGRDWSLLWAGHMGTGPGQEAGSWLPCALRSMRPSDSAPRLPPTLPCRRPLLGRMRRRCRFRGASAAAPLAGGSRLWRGVRARAAGRGRGLAVRQG